MMNIIYAKSTSVFLSDGDINSDCTEVWHAYSAIAEFCFIEAVFNKK